MSFTQEYQKKLTTADEAVKVVKSGDRLEYGWCVTTPVALDEALAKRMPDLENIQIPWWYRYAPTGNHSD